MRVDTFMEQSGETNRIVDFYGALKTIRGLKVESLHSGSWMDDQYETDYRSADKLSHHVSGIDYLDENDLGPEDETQDDENWMDDLDESA